MATTAPGSTQRNGITVLHVEDDASVARAVGRMLRRDGYEVVSVATAEDALLELGARRFDVIVSDFNLAGLGSGADVLAACGSTPFLFLTSDDRAGGLGVLRLEKPCAPSAIRAAIESLLARRAA